MPESRLRSVRRSTHLFLASLLLALTGASARASIPPDLPMVQRIGSGVRALGMGGAYTALSNDADGLASNPAGLVRARFAEFSGSIQSRSLETRTVYAGSEESTPLDQSRIHSVGFVYPFPTWRGNLVIGFAYNREVDFDQEYARAGGASAATREEERILEEGGLSGWRMGMAVDVSPSLALGATGTILSGSSRREQEFRYGRADIANFEVTSSVVDQDLVAVSGTFGAIYRSPSGVILGMALHLPEHFTADGDGEEDVRRYEAAGDTLDYFDRFRFEDKIQLPFRTSVGLAYAPRVGRGDLTLSAQWDYADWKQIDYDGPIRTDDRRYAYRSTNDLRFGAEYRFGSAPISLRAGYLRQPVAYELIGTDVFRGQARPASFDPDRSYLTVGAGWELDPTFRLDAAYASGKYQRSGQSEPYRVTTQEEVKDRRLYIGATFRI
jgi:hypothetical protein